MTANEEEVQKIIAEIEKAVKLILSKAITTAYMAGRDDAIIIKIMDKLRKD